MSLFIKLFLAHILGDFFLQPSKWVEKKRQQKLRSPYLYMHVILVAGLSWLLLFQLQYWWIALTIFITHSLIDWAKIEWDVRQPGTKAWSFIIDQLAHIIVISICALVVYTVQNNDLQVLWSKVWNATTLKILLAYLLVTRPFGFLVGMLTQHWREEIAEQQDKDSLAKAGSWIGMLERVLVLTFVLLGQYSAIGFLVAAKSILRVSDKIEENPRKQTEYVLIGTLISFTIALLVGLLFAKIQ